jgi:hypothetical protein
MRPTEHRGALIDSIGMRKGVWRARERGAPRDVGQAPLIAVAAIGVVLVLVATRTTG